MRAHPNPTGINGRPNGTGNGHLLPIRASLAALVAIIVLVSMFVAQIHSEGQRMTGYYTAVEQALAVRAQIGRLSGALHDSVNGQRGFLLTGGQEELSRYEQTTQELSGSLQALVAVAGRPSLRPPLERLAELVPATIMELGRAITAYQQSGQAAAAEIVTGGISIAIVRQTHAALDEMRAIESKTMETLSAQVAARVANSQAVLLVLFGGILFAMFVSTVIGLTHISAHHETEENLRKALLSADAAHQEAEQANRAKTEFLTTMSHEIRTPLHAVIGTAELVLENGGLNFRQHEYLERIQTSGIALLNLVDDVLDLKKIEAGEVEMTSEPFSLKILIDNALSIVRTSARAKHLELSVLLDHSLPRTLLGDEPRLRQVLLNLLGNAVKFTDHGQVTLRVEHQGATKAGEALRFSVTDTGPGIPKSKYERLFKRFSQINPTAGRGPGTGLGLTISKRLVELMGGRIGFESKTGRGSTFWFGLTMPQVEGEIAAQPGLERLDHELSGPILVVDDLEQNGDLARKTLEAAGYTVDVASDGAQAVAAVQAKPYKLVLMDIQMEGMDGVTATTAIRSLDHPAKDVPIVAMTANVFADDVKSFKAAGMNDHLGKPFKRKQLLEKVRHWLRSRPANSENGAEAALKGPKAALDENEIESLCQTMGPQWVSRGLCELKDQLEITFEDTGGEPVDRVVLARQAHTLVARAGMLGFSELAQLCGGLEQACKQGGPLGPLLSKTQAARLQAQAAIPRLQLTLKVHSLEGLGSART
jgi:signal transduction histidine kinase/CheY-like chemotaxis protein/HPt (histidine-containing phosphotransfer) domain-containing protein